MKISSIGKRPGSRVSSPVKKPSEQDFSSFLDLAKRENAEYQLEEMLGRIKKLGEKIKAAPTLQSIKEYKKMITEYLAYVLKNYYRIAKDYNIYTARLHIRVEVINKKVEEMVNNFLENQKDKIKLIKSMDEIEGLLLDLYR